jgi:hypothetical protein
MAFIAWGLAACIRRKFALAVLITAVAAANRETAIAIPLCSALLALEDVVVRRRALAWAGLMIAAYAAVRASIVVAVPGLPEETVRLFVDGRLRLLNNFDWLASWPGALQWMVGFAFTPLGWLAFWRWIPSDLRRLHLVVLGLFLGLMWAANVYEPRAFGAVYVLSWPPIFVGMARWLTLPASNSATPKSSSDYWVDRLDRWGAALLVSGFAASVVLAI